MPTTTYLFKKKSSMGFHIKKSERRGIYLCDSSIDEIAREAVNHLRNAIGKNAASHAHENRVKRDGERYHVTIISKAEFDEVNDIEACGSYLTNGHADGLLLGMDVFFMETSCTAPHNGSVAFFKRVLCPRASALRKRLGLPEKHFHITIGFTSSDVHVETKRSPLSSKTIGPCFHMPSQLLSAVRSSMTTENIDVLEELPQLLDVVERMSDDKLESKLLRCRILNKTNGGDMNVLANQAELGLDYVKAPDEALTRPTAEMVENLASLLGATCYKMKKWQRACDALSRAHFLQCRFYSGHATTKRQASRKRQVSEMLTMCVTKHGCYMDTPPLLKFPRTRHLGDSAINPKLWGMPLRSRQNHKHSAVSRDDLLCCAKSIKNICNSLCHVQEKIDGANLGVSIDYDGMILFQNRSKYICSADHEQYAPLALWRRTHAKYLHALLEPGKHILFGEWCVARHSIHYDKLPAHFVAFDIFDRNANRFFSRKRMMSRMIEAARDIGEELPPIPCVPLIGTKSFASPTEILPLLELQSKFSKSNTLEGIYLHVDDDDWNRERCKLVRSDFISGIEAHWSRTKIVKNVIDLEFAQSYLKECHGNIQIHSCPDAVLPINPRTRHLVQEGSDLITMMRNFSFILLPGKKRGGIAVASTPKSRDHIRGLKQLGITLVVTLTLEEPLPKEWFDESIRNIMVPVVNYEAPTIQQMAWIEDIVRNEIQSGGSVLEHCGGGKGRAGTVAACLMLCGNIFNSNRNQSSSDACAAIRNLRPGSIETKQQARFVREYANYKWMIDDGQNAARSSKSPEKAPETKKSGARDARRRDKIRKDAIKRIPRFVILVGFPGSGKSFFSQALVKHGKGNFIRASQDDMGRRSFESVLGKHASGASTKKIVCDRCNVSKLDRKQILELLFNPSPNKVAAVFFDVDELECAKRVTARMDHPKIRSKNLKGNMKIIKSFSSRLEEPERDEGFSAVYKVRSFQEANALLEKWGCCE